VAAVTPTPDDPAPTVQPAVHRAIHHRRHAHKRPTDDKGPAETTADTDWAAGFAK